MADSVFQCHVNLFVNFLPLLTFFSFNLMTRSSSLFTPFNCTYLLISFDPILFMSLLMVQVAFCHELIHWSLASHIISLSANRTWSSTPLLIWFTFACCNVLGCPIAVLPPMSPPICSSFSFSTIHSLIWYKSFRNLWSHIILILAYCSSVLSPMLLIIVQFALSWSLVPPRYDLRPHHMLSPMYNFRIC